jgi:hypothetical protein
MPALFQLARAYGTDGHDGGFGLDFVSQSFVAL